MAFPTFDNYLNFAASTVATAPSPATSGTSLVVASGTGASFPSPNFNAVVWPSGVNPTQANAEIVRVTSISTDTFTITRTVESTAAISIASGYNIAANITLKALTDIQGAFPGNGYMTSNVSTTTTTGINATGLAFNIVAAGVYQFTGNLMAQASVTTGGTKLGLTVPTGTTGWFTYFGPATSVSTITWNNALSTFGSVQGTKVAGVASEVPILVNGWLTAGATTPGTVQVIFASQVTTSTVTLFAGSSVNAFRIA